MTSTKNPANIARQEEVRERYLAFLGTDDVKYSHPRRRLLAEMLWAWSQTDPNGWKEYHCVMSSLRSFMQGKYGMHKAKCLMLNDALAVLEGREAGVDPTKHIPLRVPMQKASAPPPITEVVEVQEDHLDAFISHAMDALASLQALLQQRAA